MMDPLSTEVKDHASAIATEIVNRINRMAPYIWTDKKSVPVQAQALLVEVIRELQKQVKK